MKTLREMGGYQKGDERILGNGDFVERVLAQAEENRERKIHLKAKGFDFDKVVDRVTGLLGLQRTEVLASGKYKKVLAARRLVCFLGVRELGMSQNQLALRFGISQPAVSMAVGRGEQLAKDRNSSII